MTRTVIVRVYINDQGLVQMFLAAKQRKALAELLANEWSPSVKGFRSTEVRLVPLTKKKGKANG